MTRATDLEIAYGPGGLADILLPGGRVSIRGLCGTARSGTDGVVFLRQVHGAVILADPAGGEEADGMILTDDRRAPGLRVADCLPVLILGKGYRAAFHAGWRGLAAEIPRRMTERLPAPPDWVVLGPCICPDCYRVGADVRLAVLDGLPPEGHPPGGLDLAKAALDGMLAAGLPAETPVLRVPECTRCRGDLFHSFRADGTTGRNLVWLTPLGGGDEVAPDPGGGHIPTSGNLAASS